MKNLKIGVRLGGGFAAVLLLLLSLTVVGIVQMQSASKETDALVNVKVRNERLIGEWTKVIEVNAARTAAAGKSAIPPIKNSSRRKWRPRPHGPRKSRTTSARAN